ncbi:MAG: adenylate kinase [Flavobacteriaceae bacterium]|nr:adenylate kinase [Flavobacteriaceae bacterium]|tara:strand:- start:730 stop:1305 length:576 start_codon:yes stop_codon:yes gene_type:complete
MINVILFGKPGAGKGTQADFLKKKFNLIHISTGDLFRNNIKNKTQLGLLAKSFMDKGDLVPDEVTVDMLKDEVNKNSDVRGFIFDGFPRTISQAQALDKFLKSINMTINATISLEADDYVLEKRLIKRGMLNGRSDDQDISKIRNRFKEYNLKTSPLKKYYDDYGKLYTISGIGSINEIKNKLINLIKKIN